jgi:cytochrome c-type biogenesis protein CcmH
MFLLPALILTASAIFCVLFPLSRQIAAGEELTRLATQRRRLAALTALLFIPLFSFGLYSRLGHPNLPDMPLEQRRATNLDDADFSTLISRLEEHLRQDKGDARGWMLLARSYRSTGRFDDSARAYREILKIEKDDIPALLGLGEVLSQMAGRVTPETKSISERVLQKESKHPEARYFLARAKIESGDKRGGLRELKALLDETPAGAPWREVISADIQKYE